MEYTGLIKKYPVNRSLFADEYERRLEQKRRLDVEPAYQLSVIRLNSTYMELVDKFFAWKGSGTTVMLILIGFLTMIGVDLVLIPAPGQQEVFWQDWVLLILLVVPVVCFLVWALLKDAFTYTHYPIRLNRKTRMIHVFRVNGTVLTVPWDEVFFCVAPVTGGFWEIQGHVLDADGKTVRETFALSFVGVKTEKDSFLRFWEFVRRYMEEGPQDAVGRVEFFMHIADRKESFMSGFRRMHAEWGINIVTVIVGAVIAGVIAPGRWIAMQTSKLPVWPKDIEDTCRIEPGDPCVRDARDNPPDLR